MLKITVPRHENVTIDVENVKEFHSLLNMQRASNVAWSEVRCIDHVKLLQLILSKNVPPERYNGIINLYFALAHSNATSREIENAVVRKNNGFALFFKCKIHTFQLESINYST